MREVLKNYKASVNQASNLRLRQSLIFFSVATEPGRKKKRLLMRTSLFAIQIELPVREKIKTLVTFDGDPWTTLFL